jgi:hypothetical protein
MKNRTKKQNKQYKKHNRSTRKYGGDLATNVVRGVTKDKELSKNYFESSVKVDNDDYVIRYIVPDHFLFKTVDQIFKTPEFEAILSGEEKPKCLFSISDSNNIINKNNITNEIMTNDITMFVKIQSKKNPKAYSWFVVIDSGTQVIKTGEIFNYVFYSLKAKTCEISNEKNVISIKNSKMYEKKDCENDQCKVVFTIGKNGAVDLVKKNSIYQNVLFNFFIQQQAQEQLKDGALDIGVGAGVGFFDDLF